MAAQPEDTVQLSIFDGGAPALDPAPRPPRRHELADGAWVDYQPGWLSGHLELMDELREGTAWTSERRRMYDRVVDVPRLMARAPRSGPIGALVRDMSERLSRRYGLPLTETSMALYRDGRDSVAPHGDRIGARREDTVVAIVSLGAPRRFTLRRVAGPGALDFAPGWGDLLVMGGSCQRTWLHGVPKAAHAGPRISLMFRPAPVGRAPGRRTPPDRPDQPGAGSAEGDRPTEAA